jgi:predicted transcriptional regulator
MSTAKDEVRKLLDVLPEGASLEDIQYHLYVRQKIARGLQDVETGRVLIQQEFERQIAKWLER